MSDRLQTPSLELALAAQARNREFVRATPVVPLYGEHAEVLCSLKLECLQDTGSFKIRGATNAIRIATDMNPGMPVYTISAGNMGAALARAANLMGVSAVVVVPDTAPATKLAGIKRWGAKVLPIPYEAWWQAVVDHQWEPLHDHLFVHPFADVNVMAGNATAALEIVEQVPDVEEIVCAFGGGGLICGIAAAIKALRPRVRIVAAEVETAAPVTAAFSHGGPVDVDYQATFIDGCGSRRVTDEMWEFVHGLVDDTVTVTAEQVAAAIRLLIDRCSVVAEGAGAVPVAAALASGRRGPGTVCIISGGNIDAAKLTTIMSGKVP
jgi:threonine dehydratase